MYKSLMHAMGSTGNSVSIPGILEIIATGFEGLLEHHVLISSMTGMHPQIHLILKHSAGVCQRVCDLV